MNHSFDIDIAAEVGVEAAIIFQSIHHWVARNEANQENIREGHAWVYNSRAAWRDLFPYLGEKQIRNALERLVQSGFVQRGNFSYGAVNRTYWYRLAERAKQVRPKGPNYGSAERAKPETVLDTDIDRTDPPVSPIQPERKASRRVNQPGQRLEQYLAANNLGDGCPPDFWPYAAQLGFSGDAIEHIWRNFARYWNSADARGGGRKRDWPATWQNWVDREARDGRGGRGAGRAAGGGLTAALAASLASRYGAGGGSGSLGGSTDGSGAPADPGMRYDSNGERIIPF